jgi:hypothetical protein
MLNTQTSSHLMKALASHRRRTIILYDWAWTLVTSAMLQNAPIQALQGRASHPRFHLIVSAKEASMSGGGFLCRTRLNPVLPFYPH